MNGGDDDVDGDHDDDQISFVISKVARVQCPWMEVAGDGLKVCPWPDNSKRCQPPGVLDLFFLF